MAPPEPGAAEASRREDAARALLFILGLLLGLFLVVRSATPQLQPITPDAALASLLGVLFCAAAWGRNALLSVRGRLPETLCIALGLWIGLHVLGALRSPNAGAAVPLLLNALLFALLIAAGFFLASGCAGAFRWLFGTLAGMGAVEGFYGLWLKFVQLPRLRQEAATGALALPDELLSQQARERLGSEEIFGTFEIANSYACFLLLTIFAQAGLWLDARAQRPAGAPKFQGSDALHAAFLGVQLWGLWLSGSKGAHVAFALGLWFLAAQRLSTTPGRARVFKLITVAGLSGLAGLLMLSVIGLVNLRALGASISVRLEYWRTAWKMILSSGDRLLFGSGLGSFGDLYTYFKTPLATETKEAHNDWLQLWVEFGVLGPLVWAALWYVLLRPTKETAAPVPVPAPTLDPAIERRSYWAVLAGALCGFLMLAVALDGFSSGDLWAFLAGDTNANSMRGAVAALAIPAVFAAAYGFLARAKDSAAATGPGPAMIWCARAGVGAVLVHQLVDFPMRVPAVMCALGLLGGMLAAERARGEPAGADTPRLLPTLAFWHVPLLLLALLPAIFCMLLNSGIARRAAEDDRAEYRERAAKLNPKAPDFVQEAQRMNELLASATRNTDAAYAWAPFDGKAAYENAVDYLALERRGVRTWQPDQDRREDRPLEELAAERLDEARRLRPYWPAPPAMTGHLDLQLGLRRLRAHEPDAAASYFEKALWHYRLAAQLYPNAPGLKMLVGDALLFLDRPKDAAEAYREAWETDRRIFDPNVRFSAIFHDPQPGCLAKHELEKEVVQLVMANLAQVRSETAPEVFGLRLRFVMVLAWDRVRWTASGADGERKRTMLEAQAQACKALAQSAPEDGHAAMFAAAALSLVDRKGGQEAWDAAMKKIQAQREKGEPTTTPETAGHLGWTLKLK
ncbi:MAG: O-antigen ligase family protein [Planctomycetota bacterium]|nr:O-antigen ligase family protein [Planctomycetota bacterium]